MVVGDRKIITLIAIPFSEHSVKGEGDNGQTVGDNGGFRPGGVDFTGSDVFDIFFKWNIIIGSSGICRRSVVEMMVWERQHGFSTTSPDSVTSLISASAFRREITV